MFKNYLTIATRNLMRHKAYALINFSGLAIGMACCALILLYVQYELNYDAFHTKGDRIYRVLRETKGENGNVTFNVGISGPFAPALIKDFPEVEQVIRLDGFLETWIRYEGERLYHERRSLLTTEPHFFTMFDFPFVQGDPKTALSEPNAVVISEHIAKLYFGAKNPIGKTITVEGSGNYGNYELVVTGVVKVPRNTHLHFDLAAQATLFNNYEWRRFRWEMWDDNYHARPFKAYVLLREGVDHKALEAKLPDFMEHYMGSKTRANNTYHLQPLKRMHLYTHTDYKGEMIQDRWYQYADIQNVYLFAGVAFLILLIACMNFMTLATARSANRTREVGLRKVLGAYRIQLIRQFLGEAILLSFLAALFAWGLVVLALPAFSTFLGENLSPHWHITHLILVVILVFLVGLLAGCYPALFLSAFEPAPVLKGAPNTGLKGAWIRKGLVIFQFSISILLIIGTVMVYRQLNYIQHKQLGFNKELVINLPIFTQMRWSAFEKETRFETIKQAFLIHPNIQKATAYRYDLGQGRISPNREIATENGTLHQMRSQQIDADFLDTFDIELVVGRNFRPEDHYIQTSNRYFFSILLNETAVKILGWDDPIGKQLFGGGPNFVNTVVGVVKDFHTQSLHNEIQPMYFFYRQSLVQTLGLKIKNENLPETLAFIEQTWKKLVPDRPPQYSFLDDSLDQLYQKEKRVGQVVGMFALLAILVACLGLFGLAAFTAEQRMKEISVRKVLGASIKSVILLLSKDFAKLVLIANIIAWPIAYLVVDTWLQNFVYRVNISGWVFILSSLMALCIVFGTVSYQALRAALINPIDALRQE